MTDDRSDEYKAFHAAENGGFVLTRLADVKPERVQWLWPGRIPAGKLVTLDGDPGLGKSTLALEIAATVTTGGSWPDGGYCEQPGAVLLLSAEDGLADTVRPRLDAAGADVTKVHAVEGVPTVSRDGEVTLRPPTLADVHALELAVADTGAALIVVDVIMAFLPSGADSHRDQDVRAVLGRLAGLADRTGCSVLLLRHLNKASGRDPLYRGGGSIGIVGAARSGLLVAADPDDPERRVLASVKSNLGPPPESLAYRLVGTDLGVARVRWDGSVGHSAADLLRPRGDDDEAESRTEAEKWLEDYLLAAGAATSKDTKRDAAKDGIAERTLHRARQKLGVIVSHRGYPRVTWWQLPAGTTEPSNENGGTTGATESEQAKQGGTTEPKTQSCHVPFVGATDGDNLSSTRGFERYPSENELCHAMTQFPADAEPVSMFDTEPADEAGLTVTLSPLMRRGATDAQPPLVKLSGDAATLHLHCSVFGSSVRNVRKFTATELRPYAQHDVGLRVSFVEPKKRSWYSVDIAPDNIRYAVIEVDGQVVLDSRDIVPCDMDRWSASRERFGDEGACSVIRIPAGGGDE